MAEDVLVEVTTSGDLRNTVVNRADDMASTYSGSNTWIAALSDGTLIQVYVYASDTDAMVFAYSGDGGATWTECSTTLTSSLGGTQLVSINMIAGPNDELIIGITTDTKATVMCYVTFDGSDVTLEDDVWYSSTYSSTQDWRVYEVCIVPDDNATYDYLVWVAAGDNTNATVQLYGVDAGTPTITALDSDGTVIDGYRGMAGFIKGDGIHNRHSTSDSDFYMADCINGTFSKFTYDGSHNITETSDGSNYNLPFGWDTTGSDNIHVFYDPVNDQVVGMLFDQAARNHYYQAHAWVDGSMHTRTWGGNWTATQNIEDDITGTTGSDRCAFSHDGNGTARFIHVGLTSPYNLIASLTLDLATMTEDTAWVEHRDNSGTTATALIQGYGTDDVGGLDALVSSLSSSYDDRAMWVFEYAGGGASAFVGWGIPMGIT